MTFRWLIDDLPIVTFIDAAIDPADRPRCLGHEVGPQLKSKMADVWRWSRPGLISPARWEGVC